MLHVTVRTPEILLPPVWPLPRSLATTYGISVDFSSSPYLDVSVQAVPRIALWIHAMLTEYCSAGFPHSEICGSMDMCSSPQLIAACHVLRRLPVPRHSPCALCSLTFFSVLESYGQICKIKVQHSCCSSRSTIFFIASRYLTICHVFLFTRYSVFKVLRTSFRMLNVIHLFPNEQQSAFFGGDERNRTTGLLLARQALSHLSYTPPSLCPRLVWVVGSSGLEPPTSRLSGARSNRLSYEPVVALSSS